MKKFTTLASALLCTILALHAAPAHAANKGSGAGKATKARQTVIARSPNGNQGFGNAVDSNGKKGFGNAVGSNGKKGFGNALGSGGGFKAGKHNFHVHDRHHGHHHNYHGHSQHGHGHHGASFHHRPHSLFGFFLHHLHRHH